MSNLVVMAFDNEYGAEQVRDKLVDLQKAQLIKIDDACVVVRKQDGKVKVKQAANLAGAGALGGAFWGMLIGMLFFVPFAGMAIGAAIGGLYQGSGQFDPTGHFCHLCAGARSHARQSHRAVEAVSRQNYPHLTLSGKRGATESCLRSGIEERGHVQEHPVERSWTCSLCTGKEKRYDHRSTRIRRGRL